MNYLGLLFLVCIVFLMRLTVGFSSFFVCVFTVFSKFGAKLQNKNQLKKLKEINFL